MIQLLALCLSNVQRPGENYLLSTNIQGDSIEKVNLQNGHVPPFLIVKLPVIIPVIFQSFQMLH